MTTLPLVVTQYAISGHPTRTEHWSFVIPFSKDEAQILEITGSYTNFAYIPKFITRFQDSQRLRGGCEVGRIHPDSIDWLVRKLEDVQIIHNDPRFDCQIWVLNAIQLLQRCYGGIIHPNVTEEFIRQELRAEEERWQVADDIIFERMF